MVRRSTPVSLTQESDRVKTAQLAHRPMCLQDRLRKSVWTAVSTRGRYSNLRPAGPTIKPGWQDRQKLVVLRWRVTLLIGEPHMGQGTPALL